MNKNQQDITIPILILILLSLLWISDLGQIKELNNKIVDQKQKIDMLEKQLGSLANRVIVREWAEDDLIKGGS